MTVQELINDLSGLDPDMDVILEDDHSEWVAPITHVAQTNVPRDDYGWHKAVRQRRGQVAKMYPVVVLSGGN